MFDMHARLLRVIGWNQQRRIDADMKLAGEELHKAVAQAAEGLVFTSESDYPVALHVIAGGGAKRLKRGAFPQGLCPEGARCTTQDVDAFFRPVVATKDWFGPDETARAEKFKALVALLRQNLTSVRVYKVGETTIDAFVLGRSTDGDLVGVKTTVVET
jgi:hypothetical protein